MRFRTPLFLVPLNPYHKVVKMDVSFTFSSTDPIQKSRKTVISILQLANISLFQF